MANKQRSDDIPPDSPAGPEVLEADAATDSVKKWQRNVKRWAFMREQSAAAERATRIAKGLPVDPPATIAEIRRFMKPIGDAVLNHAMVAVGELTLARALEGNPAPELYPQIAIDIYKAMLAKSMRVDRRGRKYK